MNTKWVYSLLALLFLSVLMACQTAEKSDDTATRDPDDGQVETLTWLDANLDKVLVKHRFAATNGMSLPYRLYEPSNAGQTVPLVVFLHGRGDRGTDNGSQTYKNVGLFTNEYSIVSPAMQDKFPCYVVIPQCSDKTVNEEWAKWVGNTPETPFKGLGKDGSYTMAEEPSESGAATLELIDYLIDSLAVDPARVYLVGLSMGGFGTWEFTARRPELFAAAVPMAGFSDPQQIDRIKHIPFWIFHGNADEANPVEGSQTMYRLLSDAGAEVKYTEYDSIGHGESFQLAFKEAGLIPWMFSKSKQDQSY